jgi:BirA family biotin operon repressor/biotin-[acetyl-CoA-carboxylase] ligase
MDSTLEQVFDRLADGDVHSGQRLADALGISRAAIWKHIVALRELGLTVTSEAGAGYRLRSAVQRPCARTIQTLLDGPIDLDLRFLVDSTNACLQREGQHHPPPRALIAEAQTQGRGRRARRWRSPPGGGLYLSLSWRFESGLTGLSALSLVSGIAVADVLEAYGLAAVRLKWPNDLWAGSQKLGGCLIEISGAAEGPCEAVTGLGLNLDLGDATDIDQPWTDLAQHGLSPDRNRLIADLINALTRAYEVLDAKGFSAFEARWAELDGLRGRAVRIQGRGDPIEGTARGVDSQGRLLIEGGEGQQAIGSGEVSARLG